MEEDTQSAVAALVHMSEHNDTDISIDMSTDSGDQEAGSARSQEVRLMIVHDAWSHSNKSCIVPMTFMSFLCFVVAESLHVDSSLHYCSQGHARACPSPGKMTGERRRCAETWMVGRWWVILLPHLLGTLLWWVSNLREVPSYSDGVDGWKILS